jgi:hypothetical protein
MLTGLAADARQRFQCLVVNRHTQRDEHNRETRAEEVIHVDNGSASVGKIAEIFKAHWPPFGGPLTPKPRRVRYAPLTHPGV